jgi:signal transduction histidine kinase
MSELDGVLRDALRVRLLRRMGHAVQHDFKAPVQGISWSLDLAQRAAAKPEVDDATREQINKAVAMARRELARLERNARGLMADAGVLDEEHESFDLGELVRELARHFVTEAAMRELQLVVAIPEGPVPVRGPRTDVAQTLLVCLVNSLDALSTGGRAELVVRYEGDEATVEILDDAPEAAADGEYSLAGLGRRIADHSLVAFGGRMHIEERARPWRRATCVRLPLAPGAALAAARAHPVEQSL